MGNLLYLVHRLPFPPNKGDKVRSYHLLKHLAKNHRVFLGTFVDDPADEVYVETVRSFCQELHVSRLHPGTGKLLSLSGLFTNMALGLQYYRSADMQSWVNETLEHQSIDATVVFSSVMAQYLGEKSTNTNTPMLVDFVDVDSAKWTQYAANHRWPLSWLYRREGVKLFAYERAIAARSQRSFFVTENESALFRRMAPECARKVESMSNGVDADYFSPNTDLASPFKSFSAQKEEIPLVFTGAMDYWPNIDAVTWFAGDVLPVLRQAWPQVRFYIVGRNPPPTVQSLACDSVVVTGTVPDVRPYLQHAAVIVAPLRVARGIQNKILEAMAMARPVVASQCCVEAIDARDGVELIAAADANAFVREIEALLQSPERAEEIGAAGRARVIKSYSWEAHLAGIDRHFDAPISEAPAA